MKTAIIAFGGNAFPLRGEAGTITQQFAKTRESLSQIMHFVEHGYKLCITHGKKDVITSIPNIKNVIDGKSGTIIRK